MSRNNKQTDDINWYMEQIPKSKILSREEEFSLFQQLETARREGVYHTYPLFPKRYQKYFTGGFSEHHIKNKVVRRYRNLEQKIEKQQEPEKSVYQFMRSLQNWSHVRNILGLNKKVPRARESYEEIIALENCIISSNLRYAVRAAHREGNKNVPLADRVQDSNLGLLRAMDSFNYRLGYRFLTYAEDWIQSYIQRSKMQDTAAVHIPRLVSAAISKLPSLQYVERHRFANFTEKEEASTLKITVTALRNLKKASPAMISISLEDNVGDNKGKSESHNYWKVLSHPSAEKSFEEIDEYQKQERVRKLFERAISEGVINPREAEVLRRRLGLSKKARREENEEEKKIETLQQISDSYEVSRQRIQEVEKAALEKLRKSYLAKELRELL